VPPFSFAVCRIEYIAALNPEAYLTDTLSKIAAGHPINRISELMPSELPFPRRRDRPLITANTGRLLIRNRMRYISPEISEHLTLTCCFLSLVLN
jgi:hypothetical protein